MKENNVSRRDFVKTLGVVGVGSVVGAGQALAQSNAPAATRRARARQTGKNPHPEIRPDRRAGLHARARRHL